MKLYIKISAIAVLLLCVFCFTKIKSNIKKAPLNIKNLEIVEMLTNQKFECRPSAEFMFYVETNLVKKNRGAKTINASVYILNRQTGKSNLLATENILVKNYKDTAVINYTEVKSNCEQTRLKNGDITVGTHKKAPYCFTTLLQNEAVYASYIQATN